MFKNVAGQKLTVFAFDATSNLPKSGDSANLTAYVDKDDAGVTVLADTTATEKDATNAKGYYIFDLAQAETNGDKLLFSAKSSTSNIVVIAVPGVVYTLPNRFSGLVIDAAGLADANVVKLGPSGSGTAQTARDVGSSVLLSPGTGAGQVSLAAGKVAATIGAADYSGNTPQTGDAFAVVNDATFGNSHLLRTSAYTAPDNTDIVTILADLVTLLARTDPSASLALIKAQTDNIPLMLALAGHNSGVRNEVYSGSNLTSADLCYYDTAAHALTNDGVTGLVHQWLVTVTYSGSNQATQTITQVS